MAVYFLIHCSIAIWWSLFYSALLKFEFHSIKSSEVEIVCSHSMNEQNLQTQKNERKGRQNLKNVWCRIESNDRNLNYLSGARRVNFNMYSRQNSFLLFTSPLARLQVSFLFWFVYRKWNLNKNILYRAHPSVYFIESLL